MGSGDVARRMQREGGTTPAPRIRRLENAMREVAGLPPYKRLKLSARVD
jgi:hypothetical protein